MAEESWCSNTMKIFQHSEALDQWERRTLPCRSSRQQPSTSPPLKHWRALPLPHRCFFPNLESVIKKGQHTTYPTWVSRQFLRVYQRELTKYQLPAPSSHCRSWCLLVMAGRRGCRWRGQPPGQRYIRALLSLVDNFIGLKYFHYMP